MIYFSNFDSGGLYGTHQYWRVFCTDNWGDGTGIAISEVVFLDSAGGVIPATGGTAIGSDDSTGNEYSKAFDGGATTNGWFADSGPANQWVGYNFPSAKPVERVRVTTMSSGTNFLTRMPKNCKLQYSDNGSSWSDAFNFFSVNVSGGVQTFPETPAAGYHKFWRIFVLTNASTSTQIDEIELRATSGGADQTAVLTSTNGGSSGRVLFNSEGVGNEAWRAYDNTTGSWFTNTSSGANQYNGYLFPTAVKVEEVSIKATSNNTRAPTSFRVDYSDDGSSWTTQKTISSLTWAANETKVLAAI